MGTLLTGVGVGLTLIGLTNIIDIYPSDELWIELYGIALNLAVWVGPGLLLIIYNDKSPVGGARDQQRQAWDDVQ